jgi:hypothetical protein
VISSTSSSSVLSASSIKEEELSQEEETFEEDSTEDDIETTIELEVQTALAQIPGEVSEEEKTETLQEMKSKEEEISVELIELEVYT